MIEVVRKKPAIKNQPPSQRGGKLNPYSAGGGSSVSQKNWRMNSIGLQSTDAAIFIPMMKKAIKNVMMEAMPVAPK
jgi:hypothetical protein